MRFPIEFQHSDPGQALLQALAWTAFAVVALKFMTGLALAPLAVIAVMVFVFSFALALRLRRMPRR